MKTDHNRYPSGVLFLVSSPLALWATDNVSTLSTAGATSRQREDIVLFWWPRGQIWVQGIVLKFIHTLRSVHIHKRIPEHTNTNIHKYITAHTSMSNKHTYINHTYTCTYTYESTHKCTHIHVETQSSDRYTKMHMQTCTGMHTSTCVHTNRCTHKYTHEYI